MAYTTDVFISYRRNPETLAWLREHFLPLLTLSLELELGRTPAIFVDDQIESGSSWPAALAVALGQSRVLIPLWTGNYLASVWCTREFGHMLAREQDAQLRSVTNPHGLIIPIFIHDGDTFPPHLGHIKPVTIQKCFNPRMARTSQRAEDLADALAATAPSIAKSIGIAPTWDAKWATQMAEDFFKQFHSAPAVQVSVPRFTGP